MLVTRNLPPMVGGMERLIQHIVDELCGEYQVHVVGPTGCRAALSAEVTVDEVPPSPLLFFLLYAGFICVKRVMRLRPAVIFAGSGLTAPIAWVVAKMARARCYVYLHGLDIDTEHPLYRWLWRPFIRRCNTVIANSRFTQRLAVEAGVSPAKIALLHPGVELPGLVDSVRLGVGFRFRYELGQAPIMLYVGRITARKGLLPFVRDVLPEVMRACPDARLVIVGDEPVKAVLRNDAGERERCEESLRDSGLMDAVLFLGEIQDDRLLSSAYFAANVSVFPVQERDNDNEGFGMVAIEAAAHGCLTVAYRAGGVSDAVADGVSGYLVSAGDSAAFAAAVIDVLAGPGSAESGESCRDFSAGFAWTEFGRQLRAIVADNVRRG